ncbi:chorismate-binding protein [Pelomonas sp. V22]|uniref:chorismate-binding protein n=1 Tax=Pelomonas sp. V22 TaxID=2822139 RepID=UPI0024A80160|nr:chorismate-binding protein [Pelomonas sp. V22]MDI4631902.1 chorismate-binding protein [Pelomonas sp. V22]
MSEQHRPEHLWAAFDFPRHPLAREDGERVRGAFYAPPARWLRAERADQVAAVLAEAHAAARAGAWVLGGLRYEAAPAFDEALAVQAGDQPLAEFAVYLDEPQAWPEAAVDGTGLLGWHDSQQDADEAAQIERIREYIRSGDCYQVNLTTRVRAQAAAPDLGRTFLALHASQPGGFSIFLREAGVASVSPELFFDWRALPEGPRTWLLAAQPMKGTAPRGRDVVEDEAAQAYLRTSEKERAENLMIVDLLRNDMGRIATLGSVRVPRLFELHALPTVWQMTSTVTAVSRPGTLLSDVFGALFPCGSVTGAPKVRAMEIIAELEPETRGWYCGALGLIQPGGVATFNVPIRTVEQGAEGSLRCGIGSAITLDSSAEAEIAEWRAKMRFLRRAEAPIEALETLRLQDGEVVRLAAHLARLQRTAHHFGIKLQAAKVRSTLAELAAAHPAGRWRLRLTVAADGRITTELQALADTPTPVLLALAPRAIETDGAAAEFIQHKTTRRELYQAFAADKPAAAFDLLLWNARGELTECTFGNIALQIEGRWLTPALGSGLLPGVLRDELLAQGRIHEARLTLDHLRQASSLAFFNSLRGWCPAELITHSPSAAPPAPGA